MKNLLTGKMKGRGYFFPVEYVAEIIKRDGTGKSNGTGMLCRKPLPTGQIRQVTSWTDTVNQALFEISHPAEKSVF